jgi:hypothetical protein
VLLLLLLLLLQGIRDNGMYCSKLAVQGPDARRLLRLLRLLPLRVRWQHAQQRQSILQLHACQQRTGVLALLLQRVRRCMRQVRRPPQLLQRHRARDLQLAAVHAAKRALLLRVLSCSTSSRRSTQPVLRWCLHAGSGVLLLVFLLLLLLLVALLRQRCCVRPWQLLLCIIASCRSGYPCTPPRLRAATAADASKPPGLPAGGAAALELLQQVLPLLVHLTALLRRALPAPAQSGCSCGACELLLQRLLVVWDTLCVWQRQPVLGADPRQHLLLPWHAPTCATALLLKRVLLCVRDQVH